METCTIIDKWYFPFPTDQPPEFEKYWDFETGGWDLWSMEEDGVLGASNEDPLYDEVGRCVASRFSSGITNCLYCGKELHQRADGKWYTWDADNFEYPEPQNEE